MRMPLRGRALRYYLAAWIPLVAFYALAVRSSAPEPPGLIDALLSSLYSVGTAAVLGLVARRFMPARDIARPIVVVRHSLLAVLFSATWTAVVSLQIYSVAPTSAWQAYVERAIIWEFVTGLIVYGLLATALTLVEMVGRLREQERAVARADALRITAELQALRAQLNPHFLFNTLHSITALVRSEPSRAEEALERLGACFRHTLAINSSICEEVSLGDELAFLRDYLALERMRFGDRLIVEEDIDPEALDASVLAFLLQPLAENAIRHGLAPLSRSVTLRFVAKLIDDRIVIELADDGAGSTSEATESRTGVGLRAVRQRLLARYGGDASLRIVTAPGEGCRVHVSLPVVAPLRMPAKAR